MLNKKVLISAVLSLIIIGGAFVFLKPRSSQEKSQKIKAIIYKSPDCGCCVEHAAYLEKNGFDVELRPENDMQRIKAEHNIPASLQSCHTTLIGDYFIEGHVPMEAITKLLEEKPTIDGIGLPAMPAGSPGMPGKKSEIFNIYSLKDGQLGEFINI
jgi:hypothetical protein